MWPLRTLDVELHDIIADIKIEQWLINILNYAAVNKLNNVVLNMTTPVATTTDKVRYQSKPNSATVLPRKQMLYYHILHDRKDSGSCFQEFNNN